MISEALLEVLACPLCDERPPLKLEGNYLVCTVRGHAFPIVDDIPHLLPENAISAEEFRKLTHGA